MKKKDSNLSSSYDKQIGGSHYLKYKIQPSKFVIENKRDKEGLVIDIFRTLEASRRQHNI